MQWGLQEPRPARLPDRTRPSRLEFEMANAYLRQRMCACYVSDLQDRYECPCVRDVAPECSRLNCCFPHIELEQGANECHSGRSGERQVDNCICVLSSSLENTQILKMHSNKTASATRQVHSAFRTPMRFKPSYLASRASGSALTNIDLLNPCEVACPCNSIGTLCFIRLWITSIRFATLS